LGARRRALAQTIGNARGLDINSPGVRKITLKTCDFIDISNATIPTTLGGSNNFASDRDHDSTTTTRLRHRRLRCIDYAAPIKAKFSASKKSIII
jgi:hypothetical protein